MKKIKNLKPIDIVADLKYRCPNCTIDHWVSLKESRTPNFLIVCDCDTIIKPKRIKQIVLQYITENGGKNSSPKTEQEKTEIQSTDPKIIEQTHQILKTYGFTSSESSEIVDKHISEKKYNSVKDLIEKILSNLEKSV